jgi:hypothetical protein
MPCVTPSIPLKRGLLSHPRYPFCMPLFPPSCLLSHSSAEYRSSSACSEPFTSLPPHPLLGPTKQRASIHPNCNPHPSCTTCELDFFGILGLSCGRLRNAEDGFGGLPELWRNGISSSSPKTSRFLPTIMNLSAFGFHLVPLLILR